MSKNALMHELDADNVWRPVKGAGDSSGNSSSTNIGIGGVFTGAGVDVSQYGAVIVSLQASHNSASNGLVFQGSFDNTTWFDIETHTYTASGLEVYNVIPVGQYFRVVYTNGGSATTAFNLFTTLKDSGGTILTAAGSVVGSNTVRVGVEFTRPANTDAYIAKDVVSNSTSAPTVLTFANFARVNGGSGIIVRARLMTDKKDVTATFRLHLFHTAPTAINDNSPYLLLYSNAANRIGMIDFPAMASEDPTNSTASATMRPSSDAVMGTPNLWFSSDPGSRSIFGILETTAAFTPASGQKFYVELAALLD